MTDQEQEAIKLYVNEKLSMNAVYMRTKVSPNKLRRLLFDAGYKLRDRNDTRKLNISYDFLYQKYCIDGLSMTAIGKLFNPPISNQAISRYLKQYNIPSRDSIETRSIHTGEIIWTDSRVNKLRDLLESGYSYDEAAKYFETTYHAIDNANRRHLKVPMNIWQTRDEQAVRNYLEETKDYKKTCEKFSLEPGSLINRNNKYWKIDLTCNSTLLGHPTEYNGITYRSSAEAEIAQFLDDRYIEFEYEKKVGLNNWTCDFYLPTYNLWLEYDGLLDRRDIPYSQHPKVQYYRDNKFKFAILLPRKWKHTLYIIMSLYSGESLNKLYHIRPVKRVQVDKLLEHNHYLGKAPSGSQHFYGLFINNMLVGCCSLGKGTNKSLSSGVGGEALELTRLYTESWLPKNSLSIFLSQIPDWIIRERPDIDFLVSFSDPNEGHSGSIYKACNWIYTGQGPDDYKYLLPNGEIVHKSRFRCRNGKSEKELASEAGASRLRQEGKYRFIFRLMPEKIRSKT